MRHLAPPAAAPLVEHDAVVLQVGVAPGQVDGDLGAGAIDLELDGHGGRGVAGPLASQPDRDE